jgi:CSLREA domain-containing protein
MGRRRKWLLLAAIAQLVLPALGLPGVSNEPTAGTGSSPSQGGLLYVVNTTSDTVVVGACQNGNPGCSLRGAIQAANSHLGADGIEIDLPSGSVINLTQALPSITESVSITGPGAEKVTVRRSTGGNYNVFNVATNGAVSFSGIAISNGRVTGFNVGGGINNTNGIVNVSSCSITGNFCAFGGGGIFNGATLNIRESTVSGNSNGGIFNGPGGLMNITNCTISGNAANVGGGVQNLGTVNITNSTISGNFATDANSTGGVDSSTTGTTTNIKSSIVAGNFNQSNPDVSGAFISAGFNLIGIVDGSSGFTATTDQTGTIASPLDPKLDPDGLGRNGGSTRTIALLPGSPALDKGTSNGLTGNLTTDQRGAGFPRIFDDPAIVNAAGGNGADIGAFEFLAPLSVSRKMHGAAQFGIDLPLSGAAGIECRTGGANGDHQIVATFPSPVTIAGVSVTSGTGSVSNFSVNGTIVTVNLTGVANAQTIFLTFFGVTYAGTFTTNYSLPMGVLLGDTNADRFVNSGDALQTRSRAGQGADVANFRSDVNIDGAINSGDTTVVRSRAGTTLP